MLEPKRKPPLQMYANHWAIAEGPVRATDGFPLYMHQTTGK